MTIYFLGSERDAIGAAVDNDGVLAEGGSFANATFARAGVFSNSLNQGYLLAAAPEGFTNAWVRAYIRPANSVNLNGGAIPVHFYDNTLERRIRLYATTTNTVRFQKWNGAAWEYVGDAFSMTSAIGYWTFQFIPGANDMIRVWLNDALITEVSAAGFFSTVSGGIRGIGGRSSGGKMGLSEVVIADESILTWNVNTCPPVADGTDLGGTGVYSDVDESSLNTVDAVMLETGDKHSFKASARTIATYARAIGIGAYITRTEEAAPDSVIPYLIIGGVQYPGDPISLEVGVNQCTYVWDGNPATGLAWTLSEANDADLEWGWEAG